MVPTIGEGLIPFVLEQIKSAYRDGTLMRTEDVGQDMGRDGLYEADVANFFNDIDHIYKTEKAHSPKKWHPNNTHYYMKGKSIDGRAAFCKVSSSYHPVTGQFVFWTLTSFCEWKDR
ncbi:MAG: hypothetical protein KAT62_03825 [Desulfuromonadales bacterium]|nr:hypothetical protein [Desulfuromonadales bacterium]